MFDDPNVQQLLAQSEALSAVLTCVDRGTGHEATQQLVRRVLDRAPFLTVEELTIRVAMRLIVGQEGPASYRFHPATRPYTRQLFETTARAWMIWAERGPIGEALAELHQLPEHSAKREALHLMALQPWKLAVEALLEGDPAEARRQFLRSSELGSQFGTETNPVVQWSFAASFFFSPSPTP